MASPYNLPPAWDPGYALPDNVVDEGLERRAFVTKQMPRGTYDNPSVGTGGFAVPQYVVDEGYGQGTYTTKWQPSGTYNGPRVPHWLNQRPQVVRSRRLPGGGQAVSIQPLGDTPMPEPYESYGQQAAAKLLSSVAQLPRSQQASALKVILNKVDKSAWSRTQDIWNRYRQQGMDPTQAFPLALARALSTGLAAEIVLAGQRRQAPQANSLLGLGCYGCMAALGALDVSQVTGGPIFTGGGTGQAANPNAVAQPTQTADGCTVYQGFTWVQGTPTNPGHWVRLAEGQTAVPFCPGAPLNPVDPTAAGAVRDQRTLGVQVSPSKDFAWPFGIRSDIPTGSVRNFAAMPDILILPPQVSADALAKIAPALKNTTHVMSELPQPWADWIHADMTTPASYKDSPPIKYNPDDFTNEKSTLYWFQTLGIQPGDTLYGNGHGLPAAYINWPIDNSTLGLYYTLEPMDFLKPRSDDTNPTVIKIRVSKVPDQSLEYSIVQFFTRIYDAAMDALNDLGDLACKVFGGPAGPAAGAAASTAAGVGPTVGVAGAAVAKSACGQPPPLAVAAASSILPVAILAGGAVLAVALITRRPRKKTP